MINFRYHLVSIVAVFLALGIGIIMGTAVIDRAVVDRLEQQQSGLRSDVEAVRSENEALRAQLGDLRDLSARLADEGSQRLLTGTLPQVPVLVIGVRGGEVAGLADFVTLLGRAGASYRGTLWLTDRFAVDDEAEVRDLTEALGLRDDATPAALRASAVARLGRALRPPGEPEVLSALRAAGFLDFDAPDGAPEDVVPLPDPTTRVVLVGGPDPDVPDRVLSLPLVRNLTVPRDDRVALATLVVAPRPGEDVDAGEALVASVRDDDELEARVSSVDDVDEFAGRLAAVLALADLGAGRIGHFGVGPGAQRLLPAPVE
jgi:hypothetical protein